MALVSFLVLQLHSKRALGFGIRQHASRSLCSIAFRRKGVSVVPRALQRKNHHRHIHHRHFSALPTHDETLELDGDDEVSLSGAVGGDLCVNKFQVTAPYDPTGDQSQAIERLVKQVSRGDKFSILQGITGTGKTNVMAHIIARLNKKTLVLCHNKTLASQLARELRSSLRNNHVQLFVSYYNHYVPESYNEVKNKYTAKKSSINDELDALRHLATRALVQHSDVVIVASVSCIYGMGMPKSYLEASLQWTVGETVFGSIHDIISAMQATVYTSSSSKDNDAFGDDHDDLPRGQYQLSQNSAGATLVLWPPSESYPMRVDFTCDEIDGIYCISAISEGHARGMKSVSTTTIFPAKHHLTDSSEQFEEALTRIQDELQDRVQELKSQAKHLEADRLSQRVSQDLQLLRETGTCSGVENYSRHMALREAGVPPDTLLDYFSYGPSNSSEWLLLVDESHVTLPQLKAMYGGDRSRKEKLVKHGFRLPSALDNRPLRAEEFWERISQSVFVSATPSRQELSLIQDIPDNAPVEMIIRPTYVCDPEIHIRPTQNQLDDLLKEIQIRTLRGERTLVMTLTKRDAEDLADYMIERGLAASYIHSGLNTHERSNALKSLQSGQIDCLVGVNLLREGLDLPQVSLVAVLNADSEGFLRSETALLQTIGRAARNVHGSAILYANRITNSMQRCIDATKHRRQLQMEYNAKHGKEMKSTEGSSVLSIFDLLKDQIEAERVIEIVKPSNDRNLVNLDLQSMSAPVLLEDDSRIKEEIVTDHVPSKPGVYFWKDRAGKILYIGKAKRLRSRVKSYLAPKAKHSTRIQAMLKKADSVEFILTPSDRDALLLESNLIKQHQPLYNVLLKDDESYPYICASIGDAFPQLAIVPRRQQGEKSSKYKYFGPYPHYAEINTILQAIEEKYDLRSISFQARYGEVSKAEYHRLFQTVLSEVFESNAQSGTSSLLALRSEYEEASNLFESEFNQCRDVVVAVGSSGDDESTYVVHVLQLRQGLIAGQFSYTFELETGLHTDEDFGDAIQTVLDQRHYPSGEAAPSGHFSFFPDEVLVQYPLIDSKALKATIRAARNAVELHRKHTRIAVRRAAKQGPRREPDRRALQCALENAQQRADVRSLTKIEDIPKTFVDGTAGLELADLLSLEKPPERIECYDISHTQGEVAVGSRVVFLNGRPAPHLYRRFNVRTVAGVDDYASLQEVLERRFRHVWMNGEDRPVEKSDPWAMPDLVVIDGGKGQLSSALKGMAKAHVYPLQPSQSNPKNPYTYEDSVVLQEEYPPTPVSTGRRAFVAVISLAKNKEEVFVPNSSEPVNENPDSPALLLLRSLRDESHRFALHSHRKRRSRANGL
jgi:excinuclease ABC subunit B